MNAITSNFSSFLLGLMLMGFFVIGIIISIPFIFLVVSSMLVASFSITAVFAVNRRVYSIVNDYFPIRDILVYFADRIPPSVGRVEVSHQKQRKDYEARLKAEQEELKNM
ncbi:hypothetical protein C6P40_000898 [Pichia californica]|uniref:Uncharacterized protein n=1 Tax=Pichia californica TaxID=460514 RepID=A0A9P7BGN0_9ASCO|nr:hypothetical protein C6P40_000898 [[Candida] californica]